MTKARTKAQRRVKHPPEILHPRRGRGRPSNDDVAALNARCLKFGIAPSPGARQAMRAEWAGDDLGMVLMRRMRSEDAIQSLWRVWSRFCASGAVYRRRILSNAGEVGNSALPMLPDPMQSDQSHSIDLRTGDERDRDAALGWRWWSRRLERIDRDSAALLLAIEARTVRPLWQDCAPTRTGALANGALAELAWVCEDEGIRNAVR